MVVTAKDKDYMQHELDIMIKVRKKQKSQTTVNRSNEHTNNNNKNNIDNNKNIQTSSEALRTSNQITPSMSTEDISDDPSKREKLVSYTHGRLFKYMWNKYEEAIINLPMEELQYVPVKLTDDGYEIMPGFFVIYGDGNEKIKRSRCSYPPILARADYIENMNDEEKLNVHDVGDDKTMDLEANDDAYKYSEARYYQCANVPQSGNQYYEQFGSCYKHSALLVNKYKIMAKDINVFLDYYDIKYMLGKLKECDINKCFNGCTF